MRKLHNEHLGDVDEFVENNQRLVYLAMQQIFSKVGNHYEWDDLIQEGFIGLLRAYERYEPTKSEISTFAVHHIKWQIMKYIRDTGQLVKIPRVIYTIIGQISRQKLSDMPATEISKMLGCSVKDADEALKRSTKLKNSSLNQKIDSDDSEDEFMTLLESRHDETEQYTKEFIEQLDERKRTIVEMRLQGYLQHEIAEVVGVSQVQVSRTIRNLRVVASDYFMIENEVNVS